MAWNSLLQATDHNNSLLKKSVT